MSASFTASTTQKLAGQIAGDFQRYRFSAPPTWSGSIYLLQGLKASFPSICSLLRFGYPSAIVGRVWAVIIDALDGQVFSVAIRHRPIAEGNEIDPLVAEGNSATAVVVKPLFVGICAAVLDAAPDRIKAGIASAMPRVSCLGHMSLLERFISQVTGQFALTRCAL
jgi:hypothetical protein